MRQAQQKKNLFTSNKDRVFHFKEMIDWEKLSSALKIDKETYEMILRESAGKVTGEKIAPRASSLNDKHYKIENNELVWPSEAVESYNDLKEAGLLCTGVREEYSGFGLPGVITTMIAEMMFQADAGFSTIPLLQSGVAEIIESFGSESLKQEYLPKMVSGQYTGSMDLTEPNAGSDLGGIVTRAVEKDGKIFIEGSKQFITNGAADVHLVLARDDDKFSATKGSTKGLSLYLVPRKLNDLGNKVILDRLEDKLGITSSPTLAISFDNAEGFLLGEKGKGFKHMLMLMNEARRGIGAQALGLIEAAYEDARQYALDRKQFGSPIMDLALVKKTLAEMKMHSEAIRALVYEAAFACDMERGLKGKDGREDELKKYSAQALLLTPMLKYYAAEKAVELTGNAIQVFGGVGFTREYNVERYFRDSVITRIYEGTSEIQASMFLGTVLQGKASLTELIDDMLLGTKPSLQELREKMQKGMQIVKDSFMTVFAQAKSTIAMSSELYCGYLLLKQAEKSDRKIPVATMFVNDMLDKVQYHAQKAKEMDSMLPLYSSVLGLE